MFPESKHRPASLLEERVEPFVTVHVGLNLARPVFGVGLCHGVVLRASVPEAAIDEDRDVGPCEN